MSSANLYYLELLKTHLNDEHMFSTANFSYYYYGVYFHFITPQKDVKLVNNASHQGLLAGFFLEIDNYTQTCRDIPEYLDTKEYGGLQEFISMATINASFVYAAEHKVFDRGLYTYWDIPEFQFRMGDLANIVP